MEEEIKQLKEEIKRLENTVEGQRLNIEKLNKLARDINLCKLSKIVKNMKL